MSIYSDSLVGFRFERLTVVSYAGILTKAAKKTGKQVKDHYYNCLCDCGKETLIRGYLVGKTKSCGCARLDANQEKAVDITGEKFGKLTAISKVEGSRNWLCICDCGNEKIANVSRLRSENTRSCGCLYTDSRLNQVELIAKSRRVAQGFPEDFQISSFNKLERGKTKPLVARVLKRDGFCCAWCSSERQDIVIDVHHLVPWAVSKELRFETSNLVCLCKECHLKVHQGKHTGPVNEIMTILLQGFVNYQEEYSKKEETNIVNLFLS